MDAYRSYNQPSPALSVVIVWRDPGDGVVECLHSLVRQVAAVGGELIVVTGLSEPIVSAARECVPGPRWVRIGPAFTEPRAWAAGLAEAQGEVVAFGNARCRYAPSWAEAVIAARIGGADVAAGPVVPAEGSPLFARAAYLCDYASFADPAGPRAARASSNNIAFRRRALCEHSHGRSLDKTALLAQDRFRVVWVPGMRATTRTVARNGTHGLARFHRGRHYAALRAAGWSKAFRLAAGLACMALPALLYGRLVGNRYLRSRFTGTLTFGFPWIASALAAWSLGEMAGYWAGAGSSDQFL